MTEEVGAQPNQQDPNGDDSLSAMADYAEAVDAETVESTSSERGGMHIEGRMEIYRTSALSPQHCREYDEIFPGFAEKYLTEVINETKHRRELELREMDLSEKELNLAATLESQDHQIRRRGQNFGFGVVLSAYLLAGGALWLKFEAAAIAISGSFYYRQVERE